MIELVFVGDGYAIDGQLFLLLVESLEERLQSLVVAAVPWSGVASLELFDGLGSSGQWFCSRLVMYCLGNTFKYQ